MPVLGELEQILTSSVFRLYFNPPRNSKVITFEVDGSVGEGRNANEYTWRTQDNMLELVQEDGDVHSRFAYDPRTASFLHTNDPDTHSIRNQYIVSVRQRDLISQAEDSA